MNGFNFRPVPPTEFVAGETDNGTRKHITELQNELERVYMITEALWRIVKEKFSLEDDDLNALLYAIDMQDGKQDGRVARKGPRTCSACGRAVARRHTHCLYCGEFIQTAPFER